MKNKCKSQLIIINQIRTSKIIIQKQQKNRKQNRHKKLMNSSQSIPKILSKREDQIEFQITEDYIHRQQDLQLLIRAHQKIRQLQQEKSNQQIDIVNLKNQLQSSQSNLNQMVSQHKNLQLVNQQLLQKISSLEAELAKFKQLDGQKIQSYNENNANQIDINSHRIQQNKQIFENIDNIHQHDNITLKIQNNQSKSLKPSQSTPLVLNININPANKQQRKLFLSTCKQQFTKQLQKISSSQGIKQINHKKSKFQLHNSNTLTRNKSQYFSNKDTQHYRTPTNSFIKTAQKQFYNNFSSKTIKNNCTSNITLYQSLRKNNFTDNSMHSKVQKNYIFNDRTNQNKDEQRLNEVKNNVFNSKQASVNQLMSNISKTQNKYKNQAYLKLNTTGSLHNNYFCKQGKDQVSTHQKYNSVVNPFSSSVKNQSKKRNNSIYFKSQLQNMNEINKKVDNINRKKKCLELQLSNENYGMIKYRGLII